MQRIRNKSHQRGNLIKGDQEAKTKPTLFIPTQMNIQHKFSEKNEIGIWAIVFHTSWDSDITVKLMLFKKHNIS